MKLPCILCLLLLAASGLFAQQTITGTLQVKGVDRTYLVHVPAGAEKGRPLPLLLVFHGAGMTSGLMAQVTGLNEWADKTGFLVVYPQGLEQHWNTTPQLGVDDSDFTFIRELIAKIEGTYAVQRSRVIVAGMSNGAEFAQSLGCRNDFQFAAVVSVSATLTVEAARHCDPKHTVRLIQFHGTADPIVPYLGGRVVAPGGPMEISVADDLREWAQINRCATEPKTDRLADNGEDGTHLERVTFHGCAAGGEVTHYRIVGGGHTWPGPTDSPKMFGQTTHQIDASRYIARLVAGEVEP